MRKILLAILIIIMPTLVCAKDKATMYLDLTWNPTFINAENKMLKFKEEEGYVVSYEGDMTVYDFSTVEDDEQHEGEEKLVVDDSDSFTITPTNGDPFENFYVSIFSKKHEHLYANTQYAQEIKIVGNGVTIASEPGSSCIYAFGGYMPKQKVFCNISGTMIGKVSVSDSAKGIIFVGPKGIVDVSLSNKKDDTVYGDIENYFYSFGGETIIKMKNKHPVVKKGIMLNKRKTKRVTCLYLRPANNGKNMFLTWNKVKRAKSYVVYKYDTLRKKYKRIAIQNGNRKNYYNIAHTDVSAIYKYRIQPKSKKGGCGKNVCRVSYPVWAVAKNNAKANAVKVVTNKTRIKGKPGKRLRLKATALSSSDKPLFSDNIRWYCSNKKIVKVEKNTGKVKLKKKGKCKIWAKAHNGKNSEAIIVTVK